MLAGIVKELEEPGGTLILLHGNADADALASAFAIKTCFPDVEIGTPGGLDRVSKVLSEVLHIESNDLVEGIKKKRILVLDTSGPEQLDTEVDLSRSIVVDHHLRNPKWEAASKYYCDDSRNSCSEIVYELLKAGNKKITRETALALFYGILTDTGYFKYAKPGALMTVAEIMSGHGIDMDEAMNLVNLDVDISERVSQLKGAQRLKYWKIGNRLVVISQGSAFEASVCKALLGLGADIAFVGSQRGEQFRISARATAEMVRKGVHLGKLLGGVGSETTNGGGGHPGAAGMTGIGDVEAILNISAENATKLLRTLESSRD
ncbi:MAG TPA: DHH family phosphoesterase [Thermoplasmata archaeon]